MGRTSPDAATRTMINNLPAKTGKSLQQWLKILANQSFAKHGETVKWLKSEHGVTHGFANLIAHMHFVSAQVSGDELIDAQYLGAKAGLRPIYESLVEVVNGFGRDVEISPKKSYVSLRRNKQFALVQPSTKDRLDVGINLKGKKTCRAAGGRGQFQRHGESSCAVDDKSRHRR